MLTETGSIRSSEAGDVATNLSYYNTAVYLITAIALTKIIGLLYLVFYVGSRFDESIVAAPIVILFGLWVRSNLARYVGAIWLLLLSGGFVWGLFSAESFWTAVVWTPAQVGVLVWTAVVVALSVAAAWLLVLSKRFSAEFAYLRKAQPAYRTILRRVMIIGLAVGAAIATWNDIRPFIR